MAAIKTVGSSGQIALGKQYAGRHVLVDEIEPGVWLVKVGEFVPDCERWLHEPEAKAKLDRAIAWAEANPPRESDLAALEERLRSGESVGRPARSE
jgi:hypothetical protein